MANTTNFLKVEEWYRKKLSDKYPKYDISKENVPLSNWGSNGYFECDVVVKEGGKIIEVQCLSCSKAKTSSGKASTGSIRKIKADALMLTGIKCKKKILAFTEESMYDRFCQEKENGRFPNAIELLLVNVDDKKIRKTINKAAKESSKEMNNK
ncbi:MAG: hypothetical protein IKN82_11530 [Treponema sp.]|nr:hypothetical protein [Treponema sp.]